MPWTISTGAGGPSYSYVLSGDPSTANITFANQGIVLKSSSDEISLQNYAKLCNMCTTRENTVQVRYGQSILESGLPGTPAAFGFLHADPSASDYRYAIAGQTLYGAALGAGYNQVYGGGSLSSTRKALSAVFEFPSVPVQSAHLFYADGARFIHTTVVDVIDPTSSISYALGNARNVGMPTPADWSASIQPTLATVSLTILDALQNPASWTPIDNTASTTITQVPGFLTQYPDVTSSSPYAVQINVAGGGVTGGMKELFPLPNPLKLGGFNTDNIEIYVNIPTSADEQNISAILISLGVDPGTDPFVSCYQKTLVTSTVNEQTSAVSSAQTQANYQNLNQNLIGGEESTSPAPGEPGGQPINISQAPPVDPTNTGTIPFVLGAGYNYWQQVRIAKNDWQAIGNASLYDFASVYGIKIEVQTISTLVGATSANAQFDYWNLRSSGALYGVDLQWAYTFFDETTQCESDLSNLIGVPYPGANGDNIALTIPTTPGITAPSPFISHLRLYRIGGTLTQLQLVLQQTYVPNWTGTIVDTVPDNLVGMQGLQDNQPPPAGALGVSLHQSRLWIWGCQGDGGNILRYSKANLVMVFPVTNYVVVGSGSEYIIRVEEFDGELIVFTRNRIYRVTGSDEASYFAYDTNIKQGIVSPYGIAIGRTSLYMVSWDGIYEYPSGRKISEPINPIFHGESQNGMSPVNSCEAARMLYSMASWDNKLYFSYPSGSSPSPTANDSILVFDIIYERWSYYSYGSVDLFNEPYTNILVGSNAKGGNKALQLEAGYVDITTGISYELVSKDLDLGVPDAEKRFIDLMLDGDTQGGVMNVGAGFDGATTSFMGTFIATGRTQGVVPIPSALGNSQLARRMQLDFSGSTSAAATAPTQLFKCAPRFWPEPKRHACFYTDWDSCGSQGSKIFRELHIEMDTFGLPLTSIQVEVDGTSPVGGLLNVSNGYNMTTNGRTKMYYALGLDITGSLARLKIDPTAGSQVKVYSYQIISYSEPDPVQIYQTPWTFEKHPYPKLWKEIVVEADTYNQPVTLTFWLDGAATSQMFTMTHNGRLLETFSLASDTIGKMARVTATGTMAKEYSIQYVVEPLPADVTIADTWVRTLDFDRYKTLRRLWLAMKNPSTVYFTMYVDGVSKFGPSALSISDPTSGYLKTRIDLPDKLKGKLFRLDLTSSTRFQIWPEASELEVRDLGVDDGYRRQKFPPPSLN